jgi:hypothetical protein
MPDQYPFIVSNNKIAPILNRIRTAAKPEKLSQELLATWGFTASNDRAMPRVLKSLGFLTENGVPTAYYDRLRDPSDWKRVLGERVREAYADLFAIDANIQSANEQEVKGAISRITGKDEETVKRYYSTFKTFAGLADFSQRNETTVTEKETTNAAPPATPPAQVIETAPSAALPVHRKSEYHYNIQIHLPVTTDITVYNAIFKSLRDNLGI